MKKDELLLDLLDLKNMETEIPFEIFKKLTSEDLNDTPIVLRRGAVDIKLGSIGRVRIGKDKIWGEAKLELTGHLEFEPELDERQKIIGVKIKKFVYVVE
ncbi:hypothetical protein LCGC14_1524820 [marine sediment metagenome]|uniref:Uncharacterized protein n=1 Tax=marine sediment metagenome TaxID=412755 RepID=A0A0F9LD27_9ZZZZ